MFNQLTFCLFFVLSGSWVGAAESSGVDSQLPVEWSTGSGHENKKNENRGRSPLLSPSGAKLSQAHTENSVENSNSEGVSSSLNKISGMTVTGNKYSSQNFGVFLRGANTEHTLMIWNGIDLNDGTSPAGAGDINLMEREFSEHITVLKGPQSLIYGSSAIGGVILMDRDASLNSFVEIFGGNHGIHQEKIEYQDWDVDRIVYAGAQNLVSSGFNTLDVNSNIDEDGKSSQSATFIVDYPISSSEKATGLLGYYQLKTDDDSYPQDDADAFSTLRSLDSSLSAEVELSSNTKSFFQMSFSKRDRKNENESDSLNSSFYHVKSISKQVHLRNINFNSAWHIKYGLDFRSEDYEFSSLDSYTGYDELNKKAQSLGVFALREQEYFVDGLHISYGLRSEFVNQDSNQSKDQDTSVTVYQLMFQYITEKSQVLSPFAIFSSGFRTPSLFEKYSKYGFSDQNPLKPEMSQSKELGFQLLFDGKWQVQSSVFETEFSNMIAFDLASGGHYKNLKRTRMRGLEISLQDENWRGSVSQIYAKDEDSGSYLLRRPVYKSNLKYDRAWLSSSENFLNKMKQRIEADFEWQSSREDFNSVGARVKLDSFWRVNLKYTLDLPKMNWYLVGSANKELWVQGLNIFNNSCIEAADYSSVPLLLLIGVKSSI